jgi:methionyl-tRNA formyltransferase
MPSERVVLIGQGPTSHSALEGLADSVDVVAVVRSADDMTSARARQLGAAVIADASMASVRRVIEEHDPSCVVVSSYDRILGADLVERRPFVNVHYAPLPRLRGRATVNWAIINGERTATISIHHLVAGLDSGGILFQGDVPIGPASTVATVYDDLNELQRRHIGSCVTAAIAGEPGWPQDDAEATYACSRDAEDGEIEWAAPTAVVDRLVRSLVDPFPGAFTWLGLRRLYVDAVSIPDDAPTYEGRVPGRIASIDRARGTVDVLTGDGVLRLARVRVEGEAWVPAADVVRSVRATLGLRNSDLVAELLRLRSVLGAGDE